METMGDWKLGLLFLLGLLTSTAASTCLQDTPDRNILCYQSRFTEEELDPCFCTHWVLTKDLLDEKDYLLDRNEDIQIILSVETGKANFTRDLFQEGVQGIELGTVWTKSPKQLVKYVKTIVEELNEAVGSTDHLRVKRGDSHESSIEDDMTTVVTDSIELLKSTAKFTASPDTADTILPEESSDDIGDKIPRDEAEPKPVLFMRLPSDAILLAKHYDLKSLSRYVDLFILNTHDIVESRANITYHPSRLMGINDIHNADSLVDLISGLGIPKDKLILSFPSHAYQFQLANSSATLPQSPALGAPKILTAAQMCNLTKQGNWTTERDEDLTAPYTFQNNTWIAFDDEMSASIKSKYIALSNLAGAALMDIQDQDWSHTCGGDKSATPGVVKTLYDTFTQVVRKPRQTQLMELQEELHEHSMDAPTRVVRHVDRDGATRVVRRDVIVNFQCARQGYFVHPTGCNRFYRCVKFNQYTDDWTVFEYDCPAGLAFDERWEVCVWPGSLPDGGACQGSSEIAPVPRNRFQCPAQPGYYADPENCRWFFACLDHAGDGVTPLTAYEFRCPFSLVFNEKTLVCDWPWNVQGCGSQGVAGARFTYGDLLEGRQKPSYATIPDYLVSGGRIENNGGAGGQILGTYYGSNGVLDINTAGAYDGESGQYSGSQTSGSGDRGSYTSGSNQYGNYASLGNYGQKAGGAGGARQGAYAGKGAYSGSQGTYSSNAAPGSGSAYYGAAKGHNGGASHAVGSQGAYVATGSNNAYYGAGKGQAVFHQSGAGYNEGAYVPGHEGAYVPGNEGTYVHGRFPGDSGEDGSYSGSSGTSGTYVQKEGSYGGDVSGGKYAGSGGQYLGNSVGGGQYVESSASGGQYSASGEYSGSSVGGGKYSGSSASGGQYAGSGVGGGQYSGSSGQYSGSSGQYSGSSGQYFGSSGLYSGSSVSGGQYSGSSSGSYAGKEKYSGSDNSGAYVATGYGDKSKSKYYGAASGFNAGPSSTPYPDVSGQYDSGKYSAGSGEYVESALYNGAAGQSAGPVVSTTAAPFYSTTAVPFYSTTAAPFYSTTAAPFYSTTAAPFYSTTAAPFYSTSAGQYNSNVKQYSSSAPVSTTASPFLSTQSGQYLSNGLSYSGPTVAPTFASNKATSYNGFVSTPSTTAYPAGIVSSSGYQSVGGSYSGVSLSGEKFGVDGESGHIHSPSSVYSGFNQYTGGLDNLALQVNGLQPSLSENVDGSGYSTSGKVFVTPTPTPGGFSSYTPSSYSTPNPFYGSSSSLPGVFSSIYPGKSLFVSTPAPAVYSSFSPAKTTGYAASGEYVSSSSTPKPYNGVSYSTTPAPSVAAYSPTPAPYSPTVVKYSPTPAPYNPTPAPYSPSPALSYSYYGEKHSASYSPTPAPYSPSVVKYSPTPAPYSPTPVPYSPSPALSYSTYGEKHSASYSPSPAPYSPSVVKYSSTPAPYSPTPAPYAPSVVKYSPTPAPYNPTPAPYSPSPSYSSYGEKHFESHFPSPVPYSPSVVKYSPTPAPYSPTPAPYSPTPAPYSPSPSPSYSSYSEKHSTSYSPAPAPYSPPVVKYSPAPAPYSPSPVPYSPSAASYSSFGEKHSYSPSPVPNSPSVISYSTTPAPSASYASYSGSYSAKFPAPSVGAPSFPSYPSGSYSPSSGPAFVSYSQKSVTPLVYPSSTASPVVYSTPAPKTYYPTSTPAPIVQYTGAPLFSGSLTGFPQHSQFSGHSEYVSNFGPGYVAGEKQYSGASYTADAGKYGTKLPTYSTTEKSYASSTAAPIVYSTTGAPVKSYSVSSNGQSYVKTGSAYGSQSYSAEEYLPPLEGVHSHGQNEPCDQPIPQTLHRGSYQTQSGFDTYPAPAYNQQSLHVNPIVVQPLPDVSSYKDYFYSTVVPSYSTPAPIAYSTTPAYYSTASPVQYSTPIKPYVPSTPAPDYQYVSSYSTPKPFVSTTTSPIYESNFVSSYSPKPAVYSTPIVSTTSKPIVNYAFGSSYSPAPIVSTTASPIVYSTTASPVTYTSTYKPSNVYPAGPSVSSSYASYSSPPVVYGPSNLQPIRTFQSTPSYEVQSYTATPKPCASNVLDIADQSKSAASSLADGEYVVGIKHQDKVVIVSRLSDFNPLLVEKLGATCDCHSQSQPIKVVRRRKILKSTTASPSEDLGSSGQYNSNSIQSYSSHKIETASPTVDVSYNTKDESEKSVQFHAPRPKKLFSAKKSAVTTTERYEQDHSHDDGANLSITEFGTIECKRAGLFRHPKKCNKFYQCNWDEWKKKFTLHEFKCPIHLAYDSNIGACNWPSKGPACSNDNLLV